MLRQIACILLCILAFPQGGWCFDARIVEDNLFDPSRRPPVKDVAKPAPAPPPPPPAPKVAKPKGPTPQLLGIAIRGGQAKALLAPPKGRSWAATAGRTTPRTAQQANANNAPVWAAAGERVGGWTLEKVEASHAILQRGREKIILSMYPELPDDPEGALP